MPRCHRAGDGTRRGLGCTARVSFHFGARLETSIEAMSGLPPIADIGTQPRNVRFVPKADIGALAVRSACRARASMSAQTPLISGSLYNFVGADYQWS